MEDYANLELTLRLKNADDYEVDFRFHQPQSQSETRLGGSFGGTPLIINLPSTIFTEEHLLDLDLYGKTLSEAFFANAELRSAFCKACAVAESQNVPLSIRLWLATDAASLHDLAWETLLHPESHAHICTSENLLFSRYLSSETFQKIELHSLEALKALVVVANPRDLPAKMQPVAVADEIARARQGFGSIPLTVLPDEAGGQRATLPNILTNLRDGFDILYLVCHGAIAEKEGWLCLEDDAQQMARHSGTEIAARIRELRTPPSLVILVSCQSAGNLSENAGGQALRALGPKLVEAGIPAVVAMQSNLRMDTAAQFLPLFLKELRRDGQIDRALAVARSRVLKHYDWWVPVLFSRLIDNQLFDLPSTPVVRGLEALGKLMEQSGEVKTSVTEFRADFNTTLEQVDRLANYKDLHDLLHRLQFEFYNVVVFPAKYFPQEITARRQLKSSLPILDEISAALNEVISRPTVSPTEKTWFQKIQIVQGAISKALNEGDPALLNQSLDGLKYIIANQPTKINGALTEAARALNLQELARGLENVSAQVQKLNLSAEDVSQFEQGLLAIRALDGKMRAQVDEHDRWQAMEIEMRQFEGDLESNQLGGFKLFWPAVRDTALALFGENPEEWAVKMRDSCLALDEALVINDPMPIIDAFGEFRARFGYRFFQVDTDLKSQCGEIRKIDDPLNTILRKIK